MKSGLVSGALSLVLLGAAFVMSSSPGGVTSPPAIPRTGAWKAFEWWYGQRAYPHGLIPPAALRDGHRQAAAVAKAPRSTLAAAGGLDAWTSIGPDNIGGRVLAVAVHPTATQTVWAGTASGGLWKTESGGTGPSPWTRVETGYPAISVSAVAIDEAHPDTIYIGTGEISRYFRPLVGTLGARSSYGLGILRSTDGGATWDTTGLSWGFQNITAVQRIVVNPQNSSTVFAATSEGVYRSTDAGATWAVSNPELMAMDLVMNPADTTILISSHGNLNSTPNPGLYRSVDGGASWSKLQTGLPGVNVGRTSLGLCRSDPSMVYAGIADGATSRLIGLYRSTDGGATWSLRATTNYVGVQGWYDNVIAVHPVDPAVVYAAGFDIHKSSDGGTSLPAISSGWVHVDHHAIAFDPSDPGTVYFGTDGGMFKTEDGGATFVDLNDGFLTTQFYPGFANAFDDSAVALGGLQDNGTLRYNGQPSWIPVWGGDGGWCAVDPTNKNTVYAESQYGRIVRSWSGGGAFTQITLGLPGGQTEWNFIPPFVIAPSNPAILYAGSRTVYKTTNQGSTWFSPSGSSSLNGTNVACIGVSWTSADTLLAATGTGAFGAAPLFQVFRSTNGGVSWSNVTGPLPDRYPTDIEFDPSDSRVAYITYSGYGTPHLFRTTDAGTSWSDVSGNLPDLPHQCVAVDPVYPHYLYAGTDLGVFQSSNGGADWHAYDDGMPDAMVLDLTVSRSNDALRASTFGSGVYQRRLPRFPVITLTSPAGPEVLVGGMVERIRWTQEYTAMVRIDFSPDGGGDWWPVADSVPAAPGHYDWTVPELATEDGLIRLTNVHGGDPSVSSVLPFAIVVNPDVLGGWNLVSVPREQSSWLKDSLFPTSTSRAYAYANGYRLRDTLQLGEGYWLKFGLPQFTALAGDSIHSDTVPIAAGWNIIGSVSSPVPVASLVEDPPGLLTTSVYGFRKGYSTADTLLPGRGYWVKAGSAGTVTISSLAMGAPPAAARTAAAEMGWVAVSDAVGFEQRLFFAAGPGGPGEELPPPPPEGSGDARYASGAMAESFPAGAAGRRTIRLTGLRSPVMVSWPGGAASEGFRLAAEGFAGADLSLPGTARFDDPPGSLRIERVPAGTPARRGFALVGNYPNPFNPVTTVVFRLDRDAPVRLTVHDNLGREVTVLADGPYPAGEHTRAWDGTGAASGVYYLRLAVDGASVSRNILLLR